jgi:hypothetical protein
VVYNVTMAEPIFRNKNEITTLGEHNFYNKPTQYRLRNINENIDTIEDLQNIKNINELPILGNLPSLI